MLQIIDILLPLISHEFLFSSVVVVVVAVDEYHSRCMILLPLVKPGMINFSFIW